MRQALTVSNSTRLDIIPITDFPDIRMRCAIHSANSGSLMVIPRENKLVRLYIQLTTTEKTGEGGSKADRSKINPEVILQSAQRILAPYKLTYRVLDWVSKFVPVTYALFLLNVYV